MPGTIGCVVSGHSYSSVGLEDLDAGFLPVLGGDGQGRLALRVSLTHSRADLEKVLKQLLAAIARCVVQAAVSAGVHCIWVGPAVKQEFHDRDAICTDGITKRRNTLV